MAGILFSMIIIFAAGTGLGWLGRSVAQDRREDRAADLAEAQADGWEAACQADDAARAALSAPQDPDIDTVDPFGDPDDGDDLEGRPAPSEAEWAASLEARGYVGQTAAELDWADLLAQARAA